MSLRARSPTCVITKWKRQAREGRVDVFSGGAERGEAGHEGQIKELHAKIGRVDLEPRLEQPRQALLGGEVVGQRVALGQVAGR